MLPAALPRSPVHPGRVKHRCRVPLPTLDQENNWGKKAPRDPSGHWRKKILCAWLDLLATNHPTGDTSHGDNVWGCSRTRCPSTRLALPAATQG